MNLQEYEARFVHRTMPASSQGAATSSARLQGDHSEASLHEESMDASLAAREREGAGLTDMQMLLDPHTGKPMTEEEMIAKIRSEIASAQAQAQDRTSAPAATTASESLLETFDADTTANPDSDISHFPDFGPTQLGPMAHGGEAGEDEHSNEWSEISEAILDSITKSEAAQKDGVALSPGGQGGSGFLHLVTEGTELLSTLPSPHYHQVASDLFESSSPVAMALRKEGAYAHSLRDKQSKESVPRDIEKVEKVPDHFAQSRHDETGELLDRGNRGAVPALQHKISGNRSDVARAATRPPELQRQSSMVNEVRQFRSLQSRRHISDILVRIHGMQNRMRTALLDDSMSIATHSRVFQKFDVIAGIIHTLGRQLRASRNMPLVLRDKHDESMRVASVECLSIVQESGVEAYTILKQLHDSLVETQEWLNNIEDEVVRIAEGTVLLGTSDASELQPVFEQLYYRWQTEKGPSGHTFKNWKSLYMRRKEARKRVIIEAVVKRLSAQQVNCIKDVFSRWSTCRFRKKRNQKIEISRNIVIMFSSKLWVIDIWKNTTTMNRRSRHMRRKLMRRWQSQSLWGWSSQPNRRKVAETRRLRAEMQYKKRICGAVLQAWHRHIVRENKMRSKLKISNDLHKIQTQSKVLNSWNLLYSKHKYQRQEIEKRTRERNERLLQVLCLCV